MPGSVAKAVVWQEEADVYQLAPVGLCLIGADLRFVRVNYALAEMNGIPAEDHIGRHVREVVPALEEAAAALMAEVVRTEKMVGPFEVQGETPAQPGVERYWSETWSPVFGSDGSVVAATISALEITDQKRAERQKDQALQETQRLLRLQSALAQLMQKALGDVPLSTVIDDAITTVQLGLYPPFVEVLAFEGDSDQLRLIAGTGWVDGHIGNYLAEAASRNNLSRYPEARLATEGHDAVTRFSSCALLQAHSIKSGISIRITGNGLRPFGYIGIYSPEQHSFDTPDVDFLTSVAAVIATAAKRAADANERALLVKEMAHRSGNILQLIGAVAAQTFKGSLNKEPLDAFKQRLSALGRSSHAIAEGGWTSTNFKKIAHDTLSPFAHQINIAGSDVLLPADLSFDLGLILHELATNSCKYGSLGTGTETVTLQWEIESRHGQTAFAVRWHDPASGRPAEVAAPSTGFGSRFIHALVTQKWHGTYTSSEAAAYNFALTIPLQKD